MSKETLQKFPYSQYGDVSVNKFTRHMQYGGDVTQSGDLSAQSGVLGIFWLNCGLTSTNQTVIDFVNKLNSGWMDWRCITTITADAPDPSQIGETVHVTVTVTEKYPDNGWVRLTGADEPCDIGLINGAGSCDVTFSTLGANTLSAVFHSWNYGGGSSDTEAHTTVEVPTERVTNGGFETYIGKSRIPQGWTASKFAKTDGKGLDDMREGDASVKIVGPKKSPLKSLKQTLTLSGAIGDAFTLSYWVKGTTLPTKGICMVQVELYNGAVLATPAYKLRCPSGTFDWRQRTLKFTAPVAYTSVVVKVVYSKISSSVWFDGVSLIK
jgi:hypothetical protein